LLKWLKFYVYGVINSWRTNNYSSLIEAGSRYCIVCLVWHAVGRFFRMDGINNVTTTMCHKNISIIIANCPFCVFILANVLSFNTDNFRTVQPTRCDVSQFIYFCKTLFMFQTVFPSIIRSSNLHIQRQVFVGPILLPAANQASYR